MTDDTLSSVPKTKLLRLPEAAHLLSPEGYVSVSTLRLEINRGRLPAQRIGKSFFVTPRDLEEFVKTCRVKPKDPAYGSNLSGETPKIVSSAAKAGSSAMGDANIALASLKSLGQKLSLGSRHT
jgi:hypothetical protein